MQRQAGRQCRRGGGGQQLPDCERSDWQMQWWQWLRQFAHLQAHLVALVAVQNVCVCCCRQCGRQRSSGPATDHPPAKRLLRNSPQWMGRYCCGWQASTNCMGSSSRRAGSGQRRQAGSGQKRRAGQAGWYVTSLRLRRQPRPICHGSGRQHQAPAPAAAPPLDPHTPPWWHQADMMSAASGSPGAGE